MDRSELIAVFKSLGASEPELWAESQIQEGIPQLARFMFLKGAWDKIVPDNEEWIEKYLNEPETEAPFSGIAKSIKKMVECGVPKPYITELCRAMCANFLSSIAYLLDDSLSVSGNEHVCWTLMQVNDDDEPIAIIDGLHESVLETDPTGRECCPREGI